MATCLIIHIASPLQEARNNVRFRICRYRAIVKIMRDHPSPANAEGDRKLMEYCASRICDAWIAYRSLKNRLTSPLPDNCMEIVGGGMLGWAEVTV